MTRISKTLALAGALFATATSAVPVQNNDDVVYETVTNVIWTVVDVTTTIPPVPASTVTAAPTSSSSETQPILSVPSESSSTSEAPPAPQITAPAPPPPAAPTTTEAPPAPQTTAPAPPPPAPKPTTLVPAPAPAPPPKPAPSSTQSGGTNGQAGTFSGDGTFYDVATTMTNPSSCGTANDGSKENVVALPPAIIKDSDCGKSINIHYKGKTATAKIVDKCPGCHGDSIDMSRHLFQELASEAEGRLHGVTWSYA